MKQLKVFNGRDWECEGGHLFVCATSIADCARLASAAYRKLNCLDDKLDLERTTVREVGKYWSKGVWGNDMEKLVPLAKRERGVWWTPQLWGPRQKPIKRLL